MKLRVLRVDVNKRTPSQIVQEDVPIQNIRVEIEGVVFDQRRIDWSNQMDDRTNHRIAFWYSFADFVYHVKYRLVRHIHPATGAVFEEKVFVNWDENEQA